MKSQHLELTLALILAAGCTSPTRDSNKQAQASFQGMEKVCNSPSAPIAIYEVRRSVALERHPTLPLTTRWDAFGDLEAEAIGGGYETPAGSFSYRVTSSHRGTNLNIWSTSIAVAAGTTTANGAVYVYCIDRRNCDEVPVVIE